MSPSADGKLLRETQADRAVRVIALPRDTAARSTLMIDARFARSRVPAQGSSAYLGFASRFGQLSSTSLETSHYIRVYLP